MKIARTTFALTGALVLFGAGMLIGANKFGKPKSVLHVITMKFKDDATADQKQQAITGIEKMAAEIPGVQNVWLKTLKVQPEGYSNIFVMEFKDEAAFNAYADHPAHKAWEKVYLPVRAQSTTHDVSN
jgi:hypothetical protein